MNGAEYAPYYCEENIWRLLSGPALRGRESYALFVFGASGCVAVFDQRAGDPERAGLAFWDYHVVALDSSGSSIRIFDFDCASGFDSPADAYLGRSFGPPAAYETSLRPFRPLFRLVPAAAFRERFDSDRSHMLKEDGSYAAPPPPWPRPKSRDPAEALRLKELIDPAAFFVGFPERGVPMPLEELRSFLRAPFRETPT